MAGKPSSSVLKLDGISQRRSIKSKFWDSEINLKAVLSLLVGGAMIICVLNLLAPQESALHIFAMLVYFVGGALAAGPAIETGDVLLADLKHSIFKKGAPVDISEADIPIGFLTLLVFLIGGTVATSASNLSDAMSNAVFQMMTLFACALKGAFAVGIVIAVGGMLLGLLQAQASKVSAAESKYNAKTFVVFAFAVGGSSAVITLNRNVWMGTAVTKILMKAMTGASYLAGAIFTVGFVILLVMASKTGVKILCKWSPKTTTRKKSMAPNHCSKFKNPYSSYACLTFLFGGAWALVIRYFTTQVFESDILMPAFSYLASCYINFWVFGMVLLFTILLLATRPAKNSGEDIIWSGPKTYESISGILAFAIGGGISVMSLNTQFLGGLEGAVMKAFTRALINTAYLTGGMVSLGFFIFFMIVIGPHLKSFFGSKARSPCSDNTNALLKLYGSLIFLTGGSLALIFAYFLDKHEVSYYALIMSTMSYAVCLSAYLLVFGLTLGSMIVLMSSQQKMNKKVLSACRDSGANLLGCLAFVLGGSFAVISLNRNSVVGTTLMTVFIEALKCVIFLLRAALVLGLSVFLVLIVIAVIKGLFTRRSNIKVMKVTKVPARYSGSESSVNMYGFLIFFVSGMVGVGLRSLFNLKKISGGAFMMKVFSCAACLFGYTWAFGIILLFVVVLSTRTSAKSKKAAVSCCSENSPHLNYGVLAFAFGGGLGIAAMNKKMFLGDTVMRVLIKVFTYSAYLAGTVFGIGLVVFMLMFAKSLCIRSPRKLSKKNQAIKRQHDSGQLTNISMVSVFVTGGCLAVIVRYLCSTTEASSPTLLIKAIAHAAYLSAYIWIFGVLILITVLTLSTRPAKQSLKKNTEVHSISHVYFLGGLAFVIGGSLMVYGLGGAASADKGINTEVATAHSSLQRVQWPHVEPESCNVELKSLKEKVSKMMVELGNIQAKYELVQATAMKQEHAIYESLKVLGNIKLEEPKDHEALTTGIGILKGVGDIHKKETKAVDEEALLAGTAVIVDDSQTGRTKTVEEEPLRADTAVDEEALLAGTEVIVDDSQTERTKTVEEEP